MTGIHCQMADDIPPNLTNSLEWQIYCWTFGSWIIGMQLWSLYMLAQVHRQCCIFLVLWEKYNDLLLLNWICLVLIPMLKIPKGPPPPLSLWYWLGNLNERNTFGNTLYIWLGKHPQVYFWMYSRLGDYLGSKFLMCWQGLGSCQKIIYCQPMAFGIHN